MSRRVASARARKSRSTSASVRSICTTIWLYVRCGRSCCQPGTVTDMAYDQELADAIRELLGTEPDITETKMFGGIAFLAPGNMAIFASGQGGALVHVDPEYSQRLVGSTAAPAPCRSWRVP